MAAPIRVLIAEDEALIRLDLREMLEEEGFSVVGEAADGEQAVALAKANIAATVEQIRPLGWHMQMYTPPAVIAALEDVFAARRNASQLATLFAGAIAGQPFTA